MNKNIEDKLTELTVEEKEILEGAYTIDKSLYTNKEKFIIQIDKILSSEKLIDIRKHTRFIDFPAHNHDYIEFNYVYKGQLSQTINGEKILLQQGELIFLNKNIVHQLDKSSEEDIIINFIIKPEFFDFITSLSDSENMIFNFLLRTMYSNNDKGEYIFFKVSDEEYIQNILKKIITELYEPSIMSSATIKLLVGLLLVELLKTGDKIKKYSEDNFDKFMIIEILKYVDINYSNGTLFEIAEILNEPHYKLSKLIKKQTNMTFKELLQDKRLTKAKELLTESDLVITDIILKVGYENPTYFYKIFKEKFGQTPKELRLRKLSPTQGRR